VIKRTLLLGALATVAVASAAQARDQINIVGSSTVYPFSTVVAERFGKGTGFNTPKVESTGSGGGLKLFCAGVGVGHPDITNSSRRIKRSEVESCAKNGVKDITEVKIGYDGIVLANSKVDDDVVYKLTKLMHDHKAELAANFGALNGFDPKRMVKDMGPVQFHPGAIKFYKEIGQWPPKSGS